MLTPMCSVQDWVARCGREGSEAGKTLARTGEALLRIYMGLQGLLGLLAEMQLVLP